MWHTAAFPKIFIQSKILFFLMLRNLGIGGQFLLFFLFLIFFLLCNPGWPQTGDPAASAS
jgi:hypothetical protein